MPKKKAAKHSTKELTEHLQRLQAEFDNFRKRTETERLQIRQHCTEHVLKELFPVLDNFELALAHTKEENELVVGMRMVHEQLKTVLANNGVTEIETAHTFNPTLHEAVQTVNDPKKKENTIIETLQAGYLIGEKVLRPAKVSVVKHEVNTHGKDDRN